MAERRSVRTPVLEIAYEESGPPDGAPVVLLHGFPDDVRAWDGVVPPLIATGHRVIVPWLRGYGATRFLDPATPRSGQQAALGSDLHDLLNALSIPRALLAGYDWGGRAACIVSALWPERVAGLVSIGGYNIQDIAVSPRPVSPEQELRLWYQWYLHTERGRAALQTRRRDLCRLLWSLWSPNLRADDATFSATAAAWDTPDFVDVVVQSYRHRHRAAPGDPALEWIEARLTAAPPIAVPSFVLEGETDGVGPPQGQAALAGRFTGPCRYALVPGAGHFLSREAPAAVVDALCSLQAR